MGNTGRIYSRSTFYNQAGWNAWNTIAWTSDIPTNNNELTNGAGYLTSHQSLSGYATQSWVNSQGFLKSQTDSQTLSVSGKSLSISGGNSVTLPFFDGNYNSLSNKPSIPSLSGYATQSWVNSQGFGTSSFSGSYNDLSNKPTIPTATGNAYNVNAQTITPSRVRIASGNDRTKVSFWNGTTYGIGMQSGFTFGALNNDYATTFQMNHSAPGRGWWFGTNGHSQNQGAMSLTTDGRMYVADSIQVGRGESHTTALNSAYAMEVYGNMSIVSGTLYIGGQGYTNTDFNKGITAHGWGNHADQKYSTFDGAYSSLSGKPTIPTNNNQLTNGAGYITSADGGNASQLSGLSVHTGTNNEANKIVRTQANGYIHAGWINTTSGSTNSSSMNRVYASYDGYIRYYTPANFGSQISQHINYNNIANKPKIPTNNNELTNGAGYSTFSGSYSDLSNKPTIPTNNNQLTNGAGYVTTDTNTTYTAGTGMSLSGTTFNCTVVNTDTNTTYSAGTGITLSGTQFSIGQDVATNANVVFKNLQSNGTFLFNGTGTFKANVQMDRDLTVTGTVLSLIHI